MKKIPIFILFFALLFSSCNSNNKQEFEPIAENETTLSEYEQGYEDGYEFGFNSAYDYAFLLYSNDANESDKPTPPDFNSFNNTNYLEGYKKGYNKGYDEGIAYGYESAANRSQLAKEDSALYSIIAEHPFVQNVILDAERRAEEEAWGEGYDEGYSEGYNVGWDDGYDDAIEWSESE